MKVTGLVPASHPPFLNADGTHRLVEIELEITDPIMIEKIQSGFINNLSLEPQPATKKED